MTCWRCGSAMTYLGGLGANRLYRCRDCKTLTTSVAAVSPLAAAATR